MTRLPLALEPLPDETWPSYLTRRAAQHGTTLAGLGTHLGLRDARGRWTGRFGVALVEDDVQRVAPMLGLAPAQVDDMQLTTYDQLAFDLSGLSERKAIAGTRAAAHTAWVWLSGTTFCPRCLAEDDGAWRLSWRIPWNTTCLRHHVHLLGACLECAGVPGLGNRLHGSAPPRVAATPDGRRCQHPEPNGQVCGADLISQSTSLASPSRMRRAHMMAELTAGQRGQVAGVERTSLQALRAWQSAIGIAVRLGVVDTDGWGRTHRWANPPRDPDVMDRLLEAVELLVMAADLKTAADVLEAWLQTAGITAPHANTFVRITQPAVALKPVLDELLSRNGRAHTLIQRRLVGQDGRAIDERGWGVDDIPQLIWPCALPENLRKSTRPDQRILRAVVSMILVRMCTDAKDWAEAGTALGFPANKARNWTRYAFSAKLGLKTDLLSAAQGVELRLANQPVQSCWSFRPSTSGSGAGALKSAQSPECIRSSSAWCPCFRDDPRLRSSQRSRRCAPVPPATPMRTLGGRG